MANWIDAKQEEFVQRVCARRVSRAKQNIFPLEHFYRQE
jgi:hypothetical protein